jgi:hypothetical protein
MASKPTTTPPKAPVLSDYEKDDRDTRKLAETFRRLTEERKKQQNPPSPSKLSEEDLRQAIRLGTKLAEEDALFKLAMKAKQVAELNSPPQTAPKPSSPPRADYERPRPDHSPAAKEAPIMDQFWVRLGLVASAIWLALIFMISSGDAGSRHDFVWLEQYGSDTFGAATYYAGAGLAIIWAACLGIPWINEARNRGEIGTPGIGSMPPKLNSANVFLGPVVVNDGTVARLINEPNGGLRMEYWKTAVGWVEAPEGSMALADFMPGVMKPVSAEMAARIGMPISEI